MSGEAGRGRAHRLRLLVLAAAVWCGTGFDLFGVRLGDGGRWPWRGARLDTAADTLSWSADGRYVVAGNEAGDAIRVDRRGRAVAVPAAGLDEVRLTPEGRLVLGARGQAFVSVDLETGHAEENLLGETQGRPVVWIRGPYGDLIVTRTVAHYTIRRSGGRASDADAAPTRNFRDVWVDPEQPLAYVDTGYGLEVHHLGTGFTLRTFDSGLRDQRFLGIGRDDAGRMVLAVQDAGGFRIWSPPDPPGPPWEVDADAPKAIAPDGRSVAVGTADGVQLYETATRAPLGLRKTRAPVVRLAFAPDGTAVAAALGDGRVRVLDVEGVDGAGTPIARPVAAIDVGRIRDPAGIAADGLRSRRPTATFGLAGATSHLGWTPAGALSGWVGDALAEVDATTGEVRRLRVRGMPGRPYAWSPDGRRIAVVTEDGVAVADARSGAVTRRLPTGGGHLQLQWRGEVLTVDAGPGLARSWDPAGGEALGEPFEASSEATARYVLSPDGRAMAVTGRSPRVVDPVDGREVAVLDAQWAGVLAAAWSPDGTRLATAGGDSTVVLWDTARWEPVTALEGAHGRELAFAPDGRRLVSASWDGAVIADVETGALIERLQFEGLLASVDWSEAGIAMADTTGSLYLWHELPRL